MSKVKKEGKKGKSRKSVLKTLKLILHNESILKKYKEKLNESKSN